MSLRKGSRRNSGILLKHLGELCIIVISDSRRDFLEGKTRLPQKVFGLVNPESNEILRKTAACLLLESRTEIRRGNMRNQRQFAETNFCLIMLSDIFLNKFDIIPGISFNV